MLKPVLKTCGCDRKCEERVDLDDEAPLPSLEDILAERVDNLEVSIVEL